VVRCLVPCLCVEFVSANRVYLDFAAVQEKSDCVFLHLLENSRLCDRSAVEAASASPEGSKDSTSPANHNGKREQDQARKEDKESRKRRTSQKARNIRWLVD
jgi:hypothetical protein